jgi:hypothetical protein
MGDKVYAPGSHFGTGKVVEVKGDAARELDDRIAAKVDKIAQGVADGTTKVNKR